MVRSLIILLCCMSPRIILAVETPYLEEQLRALAAELRCVVCQNLSVADSPSEMAQQMRGVIREQLAAGKTPQEIKDYFVSKYGQWVLLAPTKSGFSLLVWVAPFVAVIAGILSAVFLMRRWTRRTKKEEHAAISPAVLERVRTESSDETATYIDLEDPSPQGQLLRERARLYREMRELDFDFQAGRLSENDYDTLRRELEAKAARFLQQLKTLPSMSPTGKVQAAPSRTTSSESKVRFRGWQLAAGGAFLLIFGLILGVLLTKSLRPRISEQDSMTGDFLTGTTSNSPRGSDVASLLREGRNAFARKEWPKAIEAFKKVLAADPNQPEVHAYVGFSLIQAGHTDGALLAFDKALSNDPNFPAALWGKGMILYRAKQDYAGARQVFEKLVTALPAGQERAQIEKLIAEVSQAGAGGQKTDRSVKPEKVSNEQIRGKVLLDPKLKEKLDSRATLFIIARRPNADLGPPLAVKKIDRPVFPLSYALGAENVMIQGMPFTGKVNISVRLDKDGNPMTRESGNLFGEHKKNPVELGASNVDVIIDQVTP
jgi:cytochrome c-type biogenesis protein CcmH